MFHLLARLIAFELEVDDDQNRRQAELEEAQRAATHREQFIGVLGHDLRTPLTAIKGFASLVLRRPDLPEGVRTSVSRMVESTDRMGQMIADLLDFTRGRLGGGISLDRSPADLGTLCRRCLDEVQSAHPDRTIVCRAVGDLHGSWDVGRLFQVIANLVTNAVQYSPPDMPVEVILSADAEAVHFEVSNRGDPIAPDLLEHIFDPFSRGARPTGQDRSPEGLGLGLYIVRQIVLAHGGTVDARSSESAGTVFAVRLPRYPQS